MAVIFREKNIGVKLDEGNVEAITGYSINRLWGFTGANVDDAYCKPIAIIGDYPRLQLTVESEDIHVFRKINFQTKVIINANCYLLDHDNCRNGNGARVFSHQVKKTREAGFSKIRIDAAGEHRLRDILNGYYTWGRFGFSMINDSIDDFQQVMKDYGRSETTLEELLLTRKGQDFWLKYGFPWEGEFILEQYSDNSIALEKYKAEKGYI